MRIDGKQIASEILQNLTLEVDKLKKKGITPTLAMILMGDNEASARYVRQKTIKTQEIGGQAKLFEFGRQVSSEKIEKLVKKLSRDPKIHGILLQRPAPDSIKADELTELIPPEKEIDGFGSKTIYPVPVAEAVWVIVESVWKQEKNDRTFEEWLKSKKIVVIGKGETAGKPIIDHLRKTGTKPTIVDSHTTNKDEILKKADIIITSVGKHVLDSSQVKKGVILIGVGLFANQEGKLKGDYDNDDMDRVASFYSPTPGGVGPVNVACLLKNLVVAAKKVS